VAVLAAILLQQHLATTAKAGRAPLAKLPVAVGAVDQRNRYLPQRFCPALAVAMVVLVE
jgi:hypothetical protein